MSAPPSAAGPRVRGVVCTHCACLCDDLTAAPPGSADPRGPWDVAGGCPVGRARLAAPSPELRLPSAGDVRAAVVPTRWRGEAAGAVSQELVEAARPAADVLRRAGRTLVYGLSRTTTRGQRLAVALADALGGAVDVAGAADLAGAAQVGSASCTWGELRQRSDVQLEWGVDLDLHAPRFRERFFPPEIARTRIRASFGPPGAASARRGNSDVAASAGVETAALHTLRSLLAGRTVGAAAVRAATGVEPAGWAGLLERLLAARYGALVWSPAAYHEKPWVNEGLLDLVRALQAKTRFVAVPVGVGGNRVGAEDALAASAGYPRAVDFRSGVPTSLGDAYSAEKLLLRGEVDSVLLVGAAGTVADGLSTAAAAALAALPRVVVDDRFEAPVGGAAVFLPCARFDGGCDGAVHRGDEVGLPLRNFRGDPAPPAEAWLTALGEALGVAGWAFPPAEAPRRTVPCKEPAKKTSG